MEETKYKIGEVAKKLAISLRTIRFYEEEKLITPIKTPKGTRYYTNRHIERLEAILRLTKIGLTVETIRAIAKIREKSKTGKEGSSKMENHLVDLQKTIQNKIQQLEIISKEITISKKIIKKCKDCPNTPSSKGCPQCVINKEVERIKLLNLIWDT